VQTAGKIPVGARPLDIDLLAISGHKFYGPKGVGALWVKRGVRLAPFLAGGKQERNRRAGTENVPGIIGMGAAATLALAKMSVESVRLAALRDRLEEALLARIPDAMVHGRGAPRAPHILNISVPGTDSESLLMALDLRGIGCSAGSACQSGSIEPSHVLSAIGCTADLATCRAVLAMAPPPPPAPSATITRSWPCPGCGAPMRIVERLTARQLFVAALLAEILNDSS